MGTPCLAAKCFSREGISGSVCVSWQARQRKAWSVLSIDIWKEIDKELVEDKWRQNLHTMEEVKHFWIFYYNKIKLPKIRNNLETIVLKQQFFLLLPSILLRPLEGGWDCDGYLVLGPLTAPSVLISVHY